jgi:hypothetical protein
MAASIRLEPESAGFEFWLPAKAVAEIRKMVEPLIGGGNIVQ